MANNEGRTCPKCGMNLGQKHLCPVCDKTEENTEACPNPAADEARKPEPCEYMVHVQYSQTADYVSRVITFIGETVFADRGLCFPRDHLHRRTSE